MARVRALAATVALEVAVYARALLRDADLLILDEPTAAPGPAYCAAGSPADPAESPR
jgi:ABC-type sugar transport system ATPase subunit